MANTDKAEAKAQAAKLARGHMTPKEAADAKHGPACTLGQNDSTYHGNK